MTDQPTTTSPETTVTEAVPPLTADEREGMTFVGESIAAQIRDYGRLKPGTIEIAGTERVLVLRVRPNAYIEQGDVHIPAGDVDKLRALLNEAGAR